MASKAKTEFKDAVAKIREVLANIFTEERNDAVAALDTIERYATEMRQKAQGNQEVLAEKDRQIATLQQDMAKLRSLQIEMAMTMEKIVAKAKWHEVEYRQITRACVERKKVRKGWLQLSTRGYTEKAIRVHRQRLKEVVEFYVPEMANSVRLDTRRKFVGMRSGDFADCCDADNLFLLGMLIKYLAMHGRSIIFLANNTAEATPEELIEELYKGVVFVSSGARDDEETAIEEMAKHPMDRHTQPEVHVDDKIMFTVAGRHYMAIVRKLLTKAEAVAENERYGDIFREGDLVVTPLSGNGITRTLPLDFVPIRRMGGKD